MRISCFGLIALFVISTPPIWATEQEPYVSQGRAPDSTDKVVSEIRESEHRRIPLDVELKSSNEYPVSGPVTVTIIITNLFDEPLLLNRRMLINHPRLKGEISFRIIGPDKRLCQIQRLVTPMTLEDGDFVILERGQSIQRTVDVADFFDMKLKGTYQLIVYYRNDEDHPQGDLRAWKGVVRSEPTDISLR